MPLLVKHISKDGYTERELSDTLNQTIQFSHSWVHTPRPAGAQYYKGEIVRVGAWTMICVSDTTDEPAPQLSGPASFDLPDVPTWDSPDPNFTGVVESGHSYTFTEGGWTNGVQVWVPNVSATTEYNLLFIRNPNGSNPEVAFLEDMTLTAGQWNTVVLANSIYTVGEELLIALSSINNSGDTAFGPFPWVYTGTSQAGDPGAGNLTNTNQSDIVRINDFDNDAVDRNLLLDSVVPGTNITIVDQANSLSFMSYEVDFNLDSGGFHTYTVTLSGIGPGGSPSPLALCDVTFTVPTPTPVFYKELTGNWPGGNPSWADVNGTLLLDGVDQNVPNNSFGVRMQFQPAFISADWDIIAFSPDLPGSGDDSALKVFGMSAMVAGTVIIQPAEFDPPSTVQVPNASITDDMFIQLIPFNQEARDHRDDIFVSQINNGSFEITGTPAIMNEVILKYLAVN